MGSVAGGLHGPLKTILKAACPNSQRWHSAKDLKTPPSEVGALEDRGPQEIMFA